MSKIKWHGSTTARTNSAFFYLDEGASQEQHEDLMWLHTFLLELAKIRDGNGYPVLELFAERINHTHPFVAYRFTSDWAYNKFNSSLTSLGASLGRGVFDPFGNRDAYFFERYLR
jgi:hypothetical protein